MLMAYSHVAHDCIVGDGVIFSNSVGLAGHVTLGDRVTLGGMAGIHQFCRVGRHAFIAAGAMVAQDVPPFCNATGDRARLVGLNTIGLKRRGFSEDGVRALRHAYRLMFQSELKVADAVARIREELPGVPEVERFAGFVESSERGVCR